MLNLQRMSNLELDKTIKDYCRRERELLGEVLITMKEIESRKMYLDMQCASLFMYLTTKVGYAKSTAQRRIDAVALMMDVPSLPEKIKSGEVSLNQAVLVQQAVREAEKKTKTEISAEDKIEILEHLTNKNESQQQQAVASYFNILILQYTKTKTQADGSVRIELTLSKEEFAKMQRAQELCSHSLADRDIVTYINYVTERIIKQKTSVRPEKTSMPTTTKTEVISTDQLKIFVNQEENPPVPVKSSSARNHSATRGFSARQRKIILNRDQGCQHVDHPTGEKCGARWHLQADHRHSVWAGGENEIENGQSLCAQHNRRKYQRESNIRPRS